ncbi:TetR family transcriptional regulator [Spirillospora sp. NPDC048832]
MSTPSPDHATDRMEDRLARLPLRERKKLRTRKAIQDHAFRLFAAQGYDETTVEQIAAAAEISPSTFFRYFPTKEDVVVTDTYDPIMAEALRDQPPGMPPIDALRAMIGEILPQLYETDLDALKTRLRLTAEVPALRGRTFESMRATFTILSEAIAERTGRATDDPEIEAFGWAVLGVLQAALYRLLDGKTTYDELPALIDRNLEFLAKGCKL